LKTYDAAILGAGPAGCCAALRLAGLGHRVALIERARFPRPQVGESLSPGIGNLLDYLGLAPLPEAVGFIQGLPGQIAWNTPAPRPWPSEQRGSVLMVDRARFDAWLLGAARARGVDVLQPARLAAGAVDADGWRLAIRQAEGVLAVRARLLLDTTGRNGHRPYRHHATAAPTLALCARVEAGAFPWETRIEALADGWVWGSPHPDGAYRVMAFVDGATPARIRPAERFACLLRRSRLFGAAAAARIAVRPATAYCDAEPWSLGRIKLGEAAFALDPLSSSGVEKAMRFALQAAVAANTLLREPASAGLARDFYESRLAQAVAAHRRWAADYYASAHWADGQPFWQARARPREFPGGADESAWIGRLRQALGQPAAGLAEKPAPPPLDVDAAWAKPVALCPSLRIVHVPCVVDDRVRLRAAAAHPGLGQPVAFLAGTELVPLLDAVRGAGSLAQLVGLWSAAMPPPAAARLAGWLLNHGVLRLS